VGPLWDQLSTAPGYSGSVIMRQPISSSYRLLRTLA
jgi:hypothetical protein